MAPKRKATAANTDESPSKRRTRSSGPLLETQPELPTRRTPRTKSPEKASPSKPRGKAHTSGSDKSSIKENVVESEDDDELILSPPRSRPDRPTTPPKSNNPQRMIMHSVEIVTPSRRQIAKLHQNHNDTGSPGPARRRQEAHQEINGTSPLPHKIQKAAPSVSRAKSPALTTPPSKSAHASPSKSFPGRIPHTLPPHLHTCLNAQKRAVLRALQNPPDPDVDNSSEDDDDEPPTNAVTFQQLTDLLNGTITRGEGNSCLLIGPRGSGKTRVSTTPLLALPTMYLLSSINSNPHQS